MDGETPASSNRLARIQNKTRIVPLSHEQLLVGAIISERARQDKGKTSPGSRKEPGARQAKPGHNAKNGSTDRSVIGMVQP
jgi:hypothetical protein